MLTVLRTALTCASVERMRPWRMSSVVRPRSRALRWSAGRPRWLTLSPWRCAQANGGSRRRVSSGAASSRPGKAERMDGLSNCQWFGATAARTIISIPVEREHAAAAEAGRIGASGTKAEARPTIASARSRRDIVTLELREKAKGRKLAPLPRSRWTVNPFTSDKTWIPHKLIAAEVPTRDRGVFDDFLMGDLPSSLCAQIA